MDRSYPISENLLYMFLLVAALSARSLWTSLRDGDQDLAWMSAAYFAVASLLIVLFWFLSQEP